MKNKTFYSYGIIAFYKNNKNFNYLLIKRKDSYEYFDFLTGKYNIHNQKYLIKLFNGMTIKEKHNLINNNNFDNLWNELWSNKKKNIKFYNKAKIKFQLIKKNIKFYINTTSCWQEQQWGFPKGRKKLKENNLETAKREFIEETGLTINDFKILAIKPIYEINYINNIKYKNFYFIAKILNKKKLIINTHLINQFSEISDLKYLKFNDCIKKFRTNEKKKFFLFVNSIISKIN